MFHSIAPRFDLSRSRFSALSRRATLGLMMLALGLAAAAPARAAQTLSLTGPKSGQSFVSVQATFNSSSVTVLAGAQVGSLNGSSTFDAYCVDLYHVNYLPASFQVNLAHIGTLSGGNGNMVGYLYNTFVSAASSDKQKAAGLQLAIWKAEYGTSFNYAAAAGQSTADAKAAVGFANTYLTSLNANYNASTTYDATYYQAVSHPNGTNQNMVGPTGAPQGIPSINAVPEPSTLALAGTAMLTCLGYRLRRRTRNA